MRGDGDVYIKPQTKPNRDRYNEMLLVYVNDILIISHDTKPIINGIVSQFCLKEDSLHTPNRYLGTMIKIYSGNLGSECWAMSSDKYVKAAVTDVVEDLEKLGLKLKGKAYCPYEAGYRPEMDMMLELIKVGVAKFQGFIGTS